MNLIRERLAFKFSSNWFLHLSKRLKISLWRDPFDEFLRFYEIFSYFLPPFKSLFPAKTLDLLGNFDFTEYFHTSSPSRTLFSSKIPSQELEAGKILLFWNWQPLSRNFFHVTILRQMCICSVRYFGNLNLFSRSFRPQNTLFLSKNFTNSFPLLITIVLQMFWIEMIRNSAL